MLKLREVGETADRCRSGAGAQASQAQNMPRHPVDTPNPSPRDGRLRARKPDMGTCGPHGHHRARKSQGLVRGTGVVVARLRPRHLDLCQGTANLAHRDGEQALVDVDHEAKLKGLDNGAELGFVFGETPTQDVEHRVDEWCDQWHEVCYDGPKPIINVI